MTTTADKSEDTPQDEQDRKDARRYRYLKRKGKNLLHPFEASEWDELIDLLDIGDMED